MVTTLYESLLLIGEECSPVVCVEFAGASACMYTCKQQGKPGKNEDSAALIRCSDTELVLAVADGLGGVAGGDKASAIAVHELNETFSSDTSEPVQLREAILNGFEKANQKILESGSGAATTLLAVEVSHDVIRSYHVGDSAVLVTGQRGKLKYQTIAHSPIGYALESGFMGEDEAMIHDERHIISNVVGSSDMRLDLGPLIKLAQKDTLLLASDGLYDNLTVDEIIHLIRCGPLQECAQKLVDLCTQRMNHETDNVLSKPDDLTLILYRIKPAKRGKTGSEKSAQVQRDPVLPPLPKE